MIPNVAGLALFVLGCLTVLVNWMAALQTAHNRRAGIDRHVSGILLVPQILMLLAVMSLNIAHGPWLPLWLPLLVGAMDITLLRLLLVLPKLLLLRKEAKRSSSPDGNGSAQ